jgi:hypothetical protein
LPAWLAINSKQTPDAPTDFNIRRFDRSIWNSLHSRIYAIRLFRAWMKDEQLRFAERTLALRYPDPMLAGMLPSQLLNCRRVEDTGDDLWPVLNRVQEGLLRGGLSR